jgi:hypothetical protein
MDLGAKRDAVAVVRTAFEEIGNEAGYETTFVEFAALLEKADQIDEASNYIARSLKAAESYARTPVVGRENPYPGKMSFALSNLGRLMANTIWAQRGRQLLTEASDLARSVDDEKERAMVNARLAYAYACHGEAALANELASKTLASEEAWHGFGAYTVLIPLSGCLSRLGDRERLRQCLRIARHEDPTFGVDLNTQVHVLNALAEIGDIETAKKVAQELESTEVSASALVSVATAIPEAEIGKAVDLLRIAILAARSLGRGDLFSVLGSGADVLARIDGGETLWRIYETIEQVDAWWCTN